MEKYMGVFIMTIRDRIVRKRRQWMSLLCILLLVSAGGCAGRSNKNGSSGNTSGKTDTAGESGSEDGELKAVFFNVGKGDCILLTMGEDQILLDAGYEETYQTVAKELKKQGVETLDAMIITHYDKDHVGGAAEIASVIPVDTFYLPDYIGDEDKCGDLIALISKKGLDSVRVTDKEVLSLGQAEVEIEPGLIKYNAQEKNDNDASLIVKVFYREDEWLLPGDIEKNAIEIWLEENTQTFDILKLPHHGKKENNTKELIENTDPDIAVITDSKAEEASEKVLKQLEKKEIPVYRSSVNGTVTITGHGTGQYEVVSEK